MGDSGLFHDAGKTFQQDAPPNPRATIKVAPTDAGESSYN